MPLDGLNYKRDVLLTGLLGMAQIAEGLRSDFSHLIIWNFNCPLLSAEEYAVNTGECGYMGCGVGYAHRRWPYQVKHPILENLCLGLGLPESEIGAIFGYNGMPEYYGNLNHDNITPLMVADAIDKFIANKGGIYGTQ